MSRPTVGSLFSGAGGFDLGFEAAGFEIAWQVEVDKDCVSVLERHWPNTPRHGDVREVNPADLAPVDVVIFGSPCQDFSVAGKRAGLDGERSGLFGEAIRIIRGLRPAPAFCCWENVPGALSSDGGRDFGRVLDALADCGALDIAWRVLDARHFGIPQRRRRIFLVADFGAERAGQVLFEPASGSRHSAACGEAGEGVAGDVEDGAGVVGWKESQSGTRTADVVGVLDANYGSRRHNGVMAPVAAEGGNRTTGPIDVATACNAHGGPHGRQDFESETFVVANSVQASAGHHGHSSPRGDGSDNLVAVAIPLKAAGAVGSNGAGIGKDGDPSLCLDTTTAAAVATWDERNITSAANRSRCEPGLPANTLHAGGLSIVTTMAVRRLTPRETERLQGWPDDHTRWRADGSEIPDGPRYRMIGNGVAAPVAAWIGRRLYAALTAPAGSRPS